MRIVAGRLGGRIIQAPASSKTRPMSEKVRGALFNVLGDITGRSFLDLYAGSGAVGIEAVSRGAKATMVESNVSVVKVIRQNIAKTEAADESVVVDQSIESWLRQLNNKSFDVITADPPYEEIKVEVLDEAAKLLNAGGIMIVSHTSKIGSPELKSLELVQTKRYGDTALSFYRK